MNQKPSFKRYSKTLEKQLIRLQKKKYRKQEGLFVIEGYRSIEQIVQSGNIEIKALFVTSVFEAVPASWTYLNQFPPLVYRLSKQEMDAITTTEEAPGFMALCQLPESRQIEDIAISAFNRLVLCDRIQDPGNLGTMLRTASWFGMDAVIIGEGTVDPYNPKVVRSTAGATGSMPLIFSESREALQLLEKQGWNSYLLSLDDESKDISTISYAPNKSVLVVGNEANGIAKELFTSNRKKVHIEPYDVAQKDVESLNAAVALGIGLSHFTPSERT